MKTDEEKQATKDARNKNRRDARAAAKVKAGAEGTMTDVATLSPGDTFILEEVKYVVLSIDSPANHIHTNLLEEEEAPGTHGSVDFGTMVDVIAKGCKEETVVLTPTPVVPVVPATPATDGGRWFK